MPLKIIRAWWKLRPDIAKLEEISKMKLSVNVIIQMAAFAMHGLNQIVDILSPRGKLYAMAGLSLLQGIISVLAHFATPPAETTAGTLSNIPSNTPAIPGKTA